MLPTGGRRCRQYADQPFVSFKAVPYLAVTLGMLPTNPAARIKNRRVKLDEYRGSPAVHVVDDVEPSAAVTERYQQIPVVLVGTGLRPEELYGHECRDVHLKTAVMAVGGSTRCSA